VRPSISICVLLTLIVCTCSLCISMNGHYDVYRIKPGDTLFSIARSFGMALEQLVELNHIEDPDVIRAGDFLIVVKTDHDSTAAATAEDEWDEEGMRGEVAMVPALAGTGMADDACVELLGRLIYHEARGEELLGKVAVGAVVVNRVNSRQFPDSLVRVIYQPGQFPGFEHARYPARLPEDVIKAARLALAGMDPTGGALYFYNPRTTANPDWWEDHRVLVQIGNHCFTE